MPNGTSGGVGGSEVQTRSLPDYISNERQALHCRARHSMNEQAPAAEGSFAKQWIGNDLDDLAGRHPQRGIVNARTVKRPSSD